MYIYTHTHMYTYVYTALQYLTPYRSIFQFKFETGENTSLHLCIPAARIYMLAVLFRSTNLFHLYSKTFLFFFHFLVLLSPLLPD